MKVEVKIRNVYGNDLIYGVNNNAELFLRLMNKKTFNETDLRVIKSLGYEIVQVNDKSLVS